MVVAVVLFVLSLLIFTLLSAVSVSVPQTGASHHEPADCGAGQDCDQTKAQCQCGQRGQRGQRGHECDGCPGGEKEMEVGDGVMADSADMEVSRCEADCEVSAASPCSSSPCQAGGSCEEHDGTFSCYCTAGRGGQFCEESLDTNLTVPAFHGKSFIQLELGRPGLSGLRADLRLEFKTFLSTSLIYHSPGGHRRTGDFLSLSVREKHVELSFSLSGSTLSLTSEGSVVLGRWHTVRVQRYKTHAMLQLDSLPPVTGETQSSLSTLDLAPVSHLGYSPSHPLPGLQGCVRSLQVGRRLVSLVTSVWRAEGVTECDSHPCTASCHQGADCVSVWPPQAGRSLCLCPAGYTGPHCLHRRAPCQPNPCHHGGVCHHGRGITCTCRRGYSGSLCHVKTGD